MRFVVYGPGATGSRVGGGLDERGHAVVCLTMEARHSAEAVEALAGLLA